MFFSFGLSHLVNKETTRVCHATGLWAGLSGPNSGRHSTRNEENKKACTTTQAHTSTPSSPTANLAYYILSLPPRLYNCPHSNSPKHNADMPKNKGKVQFETPPPGLTPLMVLRCATPPPLFACTARGGGTESCHNDAPSTRWLTMRKTTGRQEPQKGYQGER